MAERITQGSSRVPKIGVVGHVLGSVALVLLSECVGARGLESSVRVSPETLERVRTVAP